MDIAFQFQTELSVTHYKNVGEPFAFDLALAAGTLFKTSLNSEKKDVIISYAFENKPNNPKNDLPKLLTLWMWYKQSPLKRQVEQKENKSKKAMVGWDWQGMPY